MVLFELFYCRVNGIDLITLDIFINFLDAGLFSLIQEKNPMSLWKSYVHNDASIWAGKKMILNKRNDFR